MRQLTDQEMEMIRHAEKRIQNVIVNENIWISPTISMAIIAELKSILLIGKSFRNIEIAEKVFDIHK